MVRTPTQPHDHRAHQPPLTNGHHATHPRHPQPTGPGSAAVGSRWFRRFALIALAALGVAFSAAVGLGDDSVPIRAGDTPTTHGAEAPASATPADAAGRWVSNPLDQAVPVPGHRWVGWRDHPAGRCAWLPPDLLTPLRPVSPPRDTGTACEVDLANDEHLRITWRPVAAHVTWEHVDRQEPSGIAGLDARVVTKWLPHRILPTACAVSVDTRSITSLTVLASSATQPGLRCGTAEQAAELIARRMIPTAGGTPWSATPQHPTPDALNRASACDLFQTSAGGIDGLTHHPPIEATTATGQTCEYLHRGTSARITLTHGPHQGLETTPTLNPHRTRSRTLGLLPAREENVSTGCAVTTEPIPGRTLRVTYYTDRHREHSCDIAELLAARSALRLLDSTR